MLLVKRVQALLLAGLVLGAAMPVSAQPAPPPPPPPPTTLWNFLGIPQGVDKIKAAVVNKHGKFPGLEKAPPLLAIADPALAEVDNPAIQAAQAIKAEEDLAAQKIKAIRYLATIGCGTAYKGVDTALLEAMKDPTERVRYEAIRAVASTPSATCPECDYSCCTEEIVEELARIAYERQPERPNCWYEPSARVRAAAVDALAICCPGRVPIIEGEFIPVEEGEILQPASNPRVPHMPENPEPQHSVARRGAGRAVEVREPVWVSDDRQPQHRQETETLRQAPADDEAVQLQIRQPESLTLRFHPQVPVQQASAEVTRNQQVRQESPATAVSRAIDVLRQPVTLIPVGHSSQQQPAQGQPPTRRSTHDVARGIVNQVSPAAGTVQIRFPSGGTPPIGTRLDVYHDYLLTTARIGQVEVVAAGSGMATARPLGDLRLDRVSSGDFVVLRQ